MKSSFPGTARTRVGTKVVFLLVFAFVTLAYIATPLVASACDNGGDNGGNNNNNNNNDNKNKGNNNDNKNKGNNNDNKNKKQNTVRISDGQFITLLQKGDVSKLRFTTLQNRPVKFSALRKGQQFRVKVVGNTLRGLCLGKDKARITLPSGRQTAIQFNNLIPISV